MTQYPITDSGLPSVADGGLAIIAKITIMGLEKAQLSSTKRSIQINDETKHMGHLLSSLKKRTKHTLVLVAFLIAVTVLLFMMYPMNHRSANYLLKPTGNNGIGYHDIYLINTNSCPDKLYRKNINEADFSPLNKRHCHEILLRIYYPSEEALSVGDKYYAPVLMNDVNYSLAHYKLSLEEISAVQSIPNIRTYAHLNAQPMKGKKFPVLVFLPGAGQPAQTYTNIISNLVSHGYIVIGMNSSFLNGPLRLKSGHIVKNADSGANKDIIGRTGNSEDLEFLLNNLRKIRYPLKLNNDMKFNSVGLIGHSRNGMTIINLLKKTEWLKKNYIKAAIVMDPGDLLGRRNYPLPKAVLPTLVIWSSYFKYYMHGSISESKDFHETILKAHQNNYNFTNHENFSDLSTIQYHPGYKISMVRKKITNPKNFFVGTANGHKITKTINYLVLQFCNHYLR